MRRRFVGFLSTACIVLLAAATTLAGVRISERRSDDPELAPALTLRYIDAAPEGSNPFAVVPGGPGAPGYPVLPSETGIKAPAKTTRNSSGSVGSFAKIPSQFEAAIENPADPASTRWALIVGINDYAGSTRDNIGSYQDAVALRAHLLSLGWLPDHVLLIGNRSATRPMLLAGLKWLASKSTPQSTTVFHYSGHEKPYRNNADRDRERRDVGLWMADNKLVSDGELGEALGRVRAEKMWINFAVCRAGGFSDPGTLGPNRVVTFSSPESELSYEDPDKRHSVFGYFMTVRGLVQGHADANEDRNVTVEEAFHYARPYVVERTAGHQHPDIDDRYPGEFDLRIYA